MTQVRSRRAVIGSGVLLALHAPTFALARTETEPRNPSLAGQLLVATPDMADPRFSRSVILIVRHERDGALGITINRPIQELPIARLLEALGLDSHGIAARVLLFAGGPVEPDIGFVLHSADYHRNGTIDIDGRVAMTSDPGVLSDIGHRQGPRQSLVALGYAGWGPGQLEAELAAGAWFTVPEEPALVFDLDRDKLWDEAMKRRTIPL
jgi:putative transcriptional regulator